MLTAVLPSLDGLAPELQRLYIEKTVRIGGADVKRFVLDVAPAEGFTLENTEGFRTALGTERERANKAERDLKQYGDITPEAAKGNAARLEELLKLDPKKLAEEAVRQREMQLTTAHAAELKAERERAAALKSQLGAVLVDAELRAELAKHSDHPDILLPHLTPRVTMRENATTGKLERVVLDANGSPGVANGAGDPLTVEHLIKEFSERPQFKPFFRASTPGGGSGGSGGGGAPRPGTGGAGAPRQVTAGDLATASEHFEEIASGKAVLVNKG